MGLNHFSRVLRERGRGVVLPGVSGAGCGLAFVGVLVLGMVAVGTEQLWLAVFGLMGAAFFFGAGFLQGRGERRREEADWRRGEVGALLAELLQMEQRKELGSRVHPELVPLLERVTLARNAILVAMKSEEWVRKGKAEPWKSVREGCLATADEGWADVVWLGRNLFRRKGWRRETFERNCADPSFGRGALESVEAVVVTLEELAANVKGETETDQSVISRTRQRLEELMAAEAELGEEPSFLKLED